MGTALALQLALVARSAGLASRDIVVEAPESAGVAAVVDALTAHLASEEKPDEPDRLALFSPRLGRWLDDDEPFFSVGLRSGDVLSLICPSHQPMPTGAAEAAAEAPTLVVVGGPMAGMLIPLSHGAQTLGRSPGRDIHLPDDPSVSAEHLRIDVSPDTISVVDTGSANGTYVNDTLIEEGVPRAVAFGESVRIGRTLMLFERRSERQDALPTQAGGYVAFNRPPRVEPPAESPSIDVPTPPVRPARHRLSIAAAVVPLVGFAIGAYIAHQWLLAIPAVVSPLLYPLIMLVEDRYLGGRLFARQTRAFRTALEHLEADLAALQAREAERRRSAAPSAADLLSTAREHKQSLWERRPTDPDFLELRLGSADAPTSANLRVPQGGDPALLREAEAVVDRHATLRSVPLAVRLTEGSIALCGSTDRAEGLARWLVAQAAALHSPVELAVAAVVRPEATDAWSWLKWLPHVRDNSALASGLLATGTEQGNHVLEGLVAEVRRRSSESRARFRPSAADQTPFVLVLIDERARPNAALVSELVSRGAELGFAAIWLGSEPRDVPGECKFVVELDEEIAALRLTRADGSEVRDADADALSIELATELARALAPLRDVGADEGEGRVPPKVTLLDVLGTRYPTPDWISERWASRAAHASAPVGAAAEGVFSIDLRADGPHALVGGMTGSGKSELLRSLVATMAAADPPTRLSFLLADFKGGLAFDECADLPHVAGFVTSLDARLARRVLLSLDAELHRREAILAREGVDDLDALVRGRAGEAPPRLVIVIDEFAALVAGVEQAAMEELVAGLVATAQRGRALGLHLILATQRPASVVSREIWANTNLRIALRVGDAEDSIAVIGIQDAAEIDRALPGRAFARTGHGRQLEFQAAFGGERVVASELEEVRVSEFGFDMSASAPMAHLLDEGRTQLQQLVDAVTEAARSEGLPPVPRPWLPPLPSVVTIGGILQSDEATGLPETAVPLGLRDEPGLQRQGVHTLDLDRSGGLIVYGTGGSGKTTLLRTLAVSLTARASPEHVHLYAVDFGRGLAPLDALPHFGAVIDGDDEERVTRLFSMLRRFIDDRTELLAGARVSTLADYQRREPSAPSVPRVVVLLDDYGSFAFRYERVRLGELIDVLPHLVSDGRGVGIHFVIAADRPGAVPAGLESAVGDRIVLRLSSNEEYAALGMKAAALGIDRDAGDALPSGRGFVPGDIEVQVAVVGDPDGQLAEIGRVADEFAVRYPDVTAPAVEPLPTVVSRRALPPPRRPLEAFLGLGDATLEPVAVDLETGHFAVFGPRRSGRTTALATVALSLDRGPAPPELHLLAPRRSGLADLAGWTTVAKGLDECSASAARLAGLVEGGRAPDLQPVIVVVDDAEELVRGGTATELDVVVRRGRDAQVWLLLAAERHAAQTTFGGWLREIRNDEHGLLLDPQVEVDGDLLGVRLPRHGTTIFPPGRGYLVRRGAVELVQVASD